MKRRWTEGNRVRLLENGEQYFPRVLDAIASARHEVLIETFILFEDKVGKALHAALVAAARRGVIVSLTVDGYGSPDLSATFVDGLVAAGVRFQVFGPARKLLGVRVSLFRRLHRKIVVVDGRVAFVGGINFSADHLDDYGPQAKQDYAVELEGPVVDEIHRFVSLALAPVRFQWGWRGWRTPEPVRRPNPPAGAARVMLVTRDNRRHTTDIERHYRAAIRAARREVLIANAYFFPGYRLLREMRRAAKRGVQVRLVLQGEPDMVIVPIAARLLYDFLLSGGVAIWEYCRRPLHGKVALVDDDWATVGSSNLDPLSLSLNLEANVMIRDRAFNDELRARLGELIGQHCRQVRVDALPRGGWWRAAVGFVVFHVSRRFPRWLAWLPPHRPVIHPAAAREGDLSPGRRDE